MSEPCFKKKNEDPAACGVHDVALVQHRVSIDSNSPGLGQITCYRCPVTGTVVADGKRIQARNSIGTPSNALMSRGAHFPAMPV
jgi:hypothetical protein